MKYLIIGAGGTGGILGAYMTKAGKNVTLIARNAHLAAMKEHGLTVRHLWDETVETIPVQAENMESYEKKIETSCVSRDIPWTARYLLSGRSQRRARS